MSKGQGREKLVGNVREKVGMEEGRKPLVREGNAFILYFVEGKGILI